VASLSSLHFLVAHTAAELPKIAVKRYFLQRDEDPFGTPYFYQFTGLDPHR